MIIIRKGVWLAKKRTQGTKMLKTMTLKVQRRHMLGLAVVPKKAIIMIRPWWKNKLNFCRKPILIQVILRNSIIKYLQEKNLNTNQEIKELK